MAQEIKNYISVSSRIKHITDEQQLKIVDFIIDYSFEDKQQVYTNGTVLVPLYRVLDAFIQNGNPYQESNLNNMTQEQLHQIEAWRESLDVKQNDEHIVNAMWLAEEMWERHHAILRSTDNRDFGTYMMAFSMALMEYIWMPHDIIKAVTADLDDLGTAPEEFICIHRESRGDYMVRMSYMGTTDEDHDYEKRSTLKICDTKTEAEALTAILNHANKAGHDAVTRLSA